MAQQQGGRPCRVPRLLVRGRSGPIRRESFSPPLSSSLQDRKTLTPEQVRTLSAIEREGLIIHATTPVVKTRMTRHYEGPHRDIFAASIAESRRIAGLDTEPEPASPAAGQAAKQDIRQEFPITSRPAHPLGWPLCRSSTKRRADQ